MSDDLPHDLPEGVTDWLAEVGGGTITHLHRHVARREAWVVDIDRGGGDVLEGFLRIERESANEGVSNLERETRIVQALADTDVPVTPVHGRSKELGTTLFGRDGGRSDIDELDDPAQQNRIMTDFMKVLGRIHSLDIDSLGLDDVLPERPTTPEQCGLAEVERAQEMWSFFLADYVDPLTTYGIQWLERNVPQNVSRISLVQGDTGPVNFMFGADDNVSVVIDWELGHFGDPMEDLGSVCLREFWNPAGGLTGLFETYEKESGIPYDRHAAQFHRVRQNVRDMMSIHYLVANPMPRESYAWYLCYRYLADRATVEAIADNMGIEIAEPPLPDDAADTSGNTVDTNMTAKAIDTIEEDLAPELSSEIASSRAVDTIRLVECIDRRRRFGPELDEAERAEISTLLGTKAPNVDDALAALDQRISDGDLPDEPLVQYLARKAYRDEWLYEPAVRKYPNRSWSPLD